MPLRLLPHLEAIRAKPREQRSFVAFEKRPDMIAAGAGRDMIDEFDFDDEPALDGVIGDLRVAADRQAAAQLPPLSAPQDRPRVEAMHVDASPQDFQFAEDMVAGAESRFDNLPQRFLDERVEHYTRDYDTPSPPRQEVVDGIYDYANTALGRNVLSHAMEKGLRQEMVYDEDLPNPETVESSSGLMMYNPGALKQVADAEGAEGDGHETADFKNLLAHMFGHTPIGRGALGLPEIAQRREQNSDPMGVTVLLPGRPTPERILEETRATRLFENPYRRSRGQPPRTRYFTPGDVYGQGILK